MAFNNYWPGFGPAMDPTMEALCPMFLPYSYAYPQPGLPCTDPAFLLPQVAESNNSTASDVHNPNDSAQHPDIDAKLERIESLLTELREE